MKAESITGIILVLIAAILIGYGGVSYTKREKVIDLGPIQASAVRREQFPIPPIVSWAVLGVGVVLIVLGVRSNR